MKHYIPSVAVRTACDGSSTKTNELGMRAMQERAYSKRGEAYLLIKSPPASGKSRALMYIALDKLHNQGIRKAIIAVPEKTIGASFASQPLHGFYWDWQVSPNGNLCHAPGEEGGKVQAVRAFLGSDEAILICTHATFRFAVDQFGVAAFDNCLIAIDEFHHVSANPGNKLGAHLSAFIERDRAHIVAMTGSYFRGDTEPVLSSADEAKFETVTYTYYEQLNGYEHLKTLDIGYYFYSGRYADEILNVLKAHEKTIIHIPNVNSRESTKDKIREVEHIIGELGEWRGIEPDSGFHLVEMPNGQVLKIADLVDDEPARRDKVAAALRHPHMNTNRNHVDMIIALGMAKEGFDWVWCEHVLTVGYRSSLTEIVQIIGRATRDAPGKFKARFTNLLAEPDASEEAVVDAVNNTLKAIAASLLMEQVLAPKFHFTPKTPESGPLEGFDYGENGYQPGQSNVGFNPATGQLQMEIKGLAEPKSDEARRICEEDVTEVITAFVQDKPALEHGLFNEEMIPEELTMVRMAKIVKDKYPSLDEPDREAIRQRAIAALNITQQAKKAAAQNGSDDEKRDDGGNSEGSDKNDEAAQNTAFIDGVRKYAMDVRELHIDLIDRINPFSEAYAVLAKSLDENSLKQIMDAIGAKKIMLTEEEARELARRAILFKQDRRRLPKLTANDPWERHMAEGVAFLQRKVAEEANG